MVYEESEIWIVMGPSESEKGFLKICRDIDVNDIREEKISNLVPTPWCWKPEKRLYSNRKEVRIRAVQFFSKELDDVYHFRIETIQQDLEMIFETRPDTKDPMPDPRRKPSVGDRVLAKDDHVDYWWNVTDLLEVLGMSQWSKDRLIVRSAKGSLREVQVDSLIFAPACLTGEKKVKSENGSNMVVTGVLLDEERFVARKVRGVLDY